MKQRRDGSSPPDGVRWSPAFRRLGAAAATWPMLVSAAVAIGADRPGSAAGELPTRPLVFAQVPVKVAAEVRARGATGSDLPPGSRLVRFDPSRRDRAVTILTEGFLAAGKPDVSFDGRRILFVGKRSASDPLDVWEMNVEDGATRRITRGGGNCGEAIYLSTIYTIDAEQPVRQIAFSSDSGGVPSLYTCRLDGTRIRRITFNPYGAADPCLLADGRLLYGSGQPPDTVASRAGGSALSTVNTDGTDVFVFVATHDPPAIRGMPCETGDGQVVFVEASLGRRDRGGSLIAVSVAASLKSRRVLASDSSGLYGTPAATGDGTLLVSYRPRDGGSWGVHTLDPRTGARTAIVYDAPEWHDVDAAVIGPRPEPAGRSSVVDERVGTGLLYCLDARLSGTARPHDTDGRRADRVQIFEALTNEIPPPPAERVAERLLGTAPLEADGSIHLSVPARTPLRLATLGSDGRVVHEMRNWIWVMPREARGCIGCHEDRELSPPNRHVLALWKPPHSLVAPPDASTSGGNQE